MTLNILNKKEIKKEEFLKCFLGKTIKEAEQTHNEFSKLLNIIARNYSLSTGLDKADLFGEALVGLARAKRDFDSDRSDNFRAFAVFKIKDALNKFVRDNMCSVSIPAYISKANNLINKLNDFLYSQNIDQDTIDYIIHEGVVDDIDMPYEAKIRVREIIILLERAAERADTTYEKLVSRASFLPVDKELLDFCDSEKNSNFDKIVVDRIWQVMDDIDKEIAKMIMEDTSKKDIALHFNKSITWINNRLKRIKERLG